MAFSTVVVTTRSHREHSRGDERVGLLDLVVFASQHVAVLAHAGGLAHTLVCQLPAQGGGGAGVAGAGAVAGRQQGAAALQRWAAPQQHTPARQECQQKEMRSYVTCRVPPSQRAWRYGGRLDVHCQAPATRHLDVKPAHLRSAGSETTIQGFTPNQICV